MEKLGVIIVGGAGEAATRAHIPSWLKNPHANVLALVDPNEEKIKDICNSFKIKRYYTNLEDALDKEETAKVVDLATPAKFHHSHAILSLKEGRNVIIEKPMATSQEECEEIIELAKKKNLKISIFHTHMGYPVVWKMKEFINNGELGENLFISFLAPYIEAEMQSWWKGVKTAIVHEIGIHRIYVSSYWLDGIQDVKVVIHSNDEINKGEIKDITLFLYGTKGISEITIFKTKGVVKDEIRIFGDNKKIILPPLIASAFQKIEGTEQRDYRKAMLKEFRRSIPPSGMISRGIKYTLFGRKVLPHYIISDNFVRSILYDEELIVTPEEGMEAIKILEKVDEICNDL